MKKGDIFLIILLLIAAVLWFGKDVFWVDSAHKQAVITVDGQVYATLPLSSSKERSEIPVKLPGNNYVHIISEKDQIWVENSSCPDKVCVKTGKIAKAGQSVVCLPNKTIVYIEGSEKQEVDDVSF